MVSRILVALALSFALAGPALAGQCPSLVQTIDDALAAGTSLSEDDLAKVRALRDEGQALHDAGSHGDSVAKLQEALALLGM
jgi:hypothetical protein